MVYLGPKSFCYQFTGHFSWVPSDDLGGLDGKKSACNAGDPGLILGLGRSPGEGNGNPLQYSAWKVPWTEEVVGLQSMGSQRVGLA